MKKIIGFTAVAFLACAVFAEETSQLGWQKGKSANEARKTFYSSVSQYKTEAEREAAFKAAGIGGGAPLELPCATWAITVPSGAPWMKSVTSPMNTATSRIL